MLPAIAVLVGKLLRLPEVGEGSKVAKLERTVAELREKGVVAKRELLIVVRERDRLARGQVQDGPIRRGLQFYKLVVDAVIGRPPPGWNRAEVSAFVRRNEGVLIGMVAGKG